MPIVPRTRRGRVRRGPVALAVSALSPGLVRAESAWPTASYGMQAGDVLGDRAVVWSRADRPSRMLCGGPRPGP